MQLLFAAVAALIIATEMKAGTQPLDLALPTDNDALFRGDGSAFYQYIERDFKGVKSTPWEGGRYGFVRDPVETSAGIVYTRFHEGIDIRPLQRDANDEPLDEVHAIADGKVVHVNPVPGYSNYGKYVVIEHRWDGSDYYSLYGHLSSIAVSPGQQVQKGEKIAIMGYTGVGLNRTRAHLHLELNLMLSHHFDAWHNVFFPKNDPNHNGIYNGLNLTGVDIARLYLALRKNPSLTIPEFLKEEEAYYKVTIPKSSNFELIKRYPWMLRGSAGINPPSWEVSFAQTGVPLEIRPGAKKVRQPELTYVKKSTVEYSLVTRGDIIGHPGHAQLTKGGWATMRLLTFPD